MIEEYALKNFWSKVLKTESCWIWTAAKANKGYGAFGYKYKTFKAHRISWELHRGPIPKGLFVLHKCDNPPCINPDHLFLGTNLDNVKDMISKGRNSPPPKTTPSNKIKLTKEIIDLLGKIPDKEIGRRFGFDKGVARRARKLLRIPPHPPYLFTKGMPHPRWAKRKEEKSSGL